MNKSGAGSSNQMLLKAAEVRLSNVCLTKAILLQILNLIQMLDMQDQLLSNGDLGNSTQ